MFSKYHLFSLSFVTILLCVHQFHVLISGLFCIFIHFACTDLDCCVHGNGGVWREESAATRGGNGTGEVCADQLPLFHAEGRANEASHLAEE